MIPQHNKPASIFILIPIYLPAFKAGGPLKSIANMVDHLGSEFDFHIIASDRDLGDKAAFPGVVPNTWIHVAKAKVLYVRPALRGLLAISRILSVSDYSLLYLNSVFSRLFSMLPLLILTFHLVRRVPVIVAPRGEFSPGALMIKPKRKKLYLSILRLLRLDYGIIWHASSEFERLDIIRQFPEHAQIQVAPNIPLSPTHQTKPVVFIAGDISLNTAKIEPGLPPNKEPGNLSIIFFSRVSRKKNLDGAIKLLSGLKGSVTFHIYGPIEDHEHWQECSTLIRSLEGNIHVEYRGEIRPEQVLHVLSQYHLFLLPTHGENFGHVIAESLAAGCPVLISDQTPWRNLDHLGIGWDIPLDQPENFRSVLARCVEMGTDEFRLFSRRAKSYARNRNLDQGSVIQHREMFVHSLAQLKFLRGGKSHQ
jgi:glycosyltransferase involved in cell wall biosynthesis